MIPTQLLTHRVTVVVPATVTNGYGDETLSYDEGVAERLTDVPALMTQATGSELTDARDAEVGEWLMSTNETRLHGRCQVEWDGKTFLIVGPVDIVEDEARRRSVYAKCRATEG